MVLENAFNRGIKQLLVHHPEGKLVVHILALLFRLVVGQGIHDASFDIGMVAATIFVHKVGVVIVIVIFGQFVRVGSRQNGLDGGAVRALTEMRR